jgi:hypothetical protein
MLKRLKKYVWDININALFFKKISIRVLNYKKIKIKQRS